MKLFDSFVPRTTKTTTTEEGLLLSYQSDSMKPSLHAVIAQIFIHLWLFVVVVDSNDQTHDRSSKTWKQCIWHWLCWWCREMHPKQSDPLSFSSVVDYIHCRQCTCDGDDDDHDDINDFPLVLLSRSQHTRRVIKYGHSTKFSHFWVNYYIHEYLGRTWGPAWASQVQ